MHVHCLHWLMSTGLHFQSAFYQPYKFTTGKMMAMVDSKAKWDPVIAPIVNAHLSKPFSGILAHCGYIWTS